MSFGQRFVRKRWACTPLNEALILQAGSAVGNDIANLTQDLKLAACWLDFSVSFVPFYRIRCGVI